MIERRPRNLRRHTLVTTDHLEERAHRDGLTIVRGAGWLTIDAPGMKLCARDESEGLGVAS